MFDQLRNLTMVEKDMPKVNSKEALIRITAAGIRGSDVHAYIGKHPFRTPPSILGHEIVGEIVEIGNKVVNFKVGDRVTVEPQIGCGHCPTCERGFYNLCEKKVILGTKEWDGGFAEYIVAPEQTLYEIPRSLSIDQAVLAEPLAVGVHAVNIAGIEKGDKVAILGSGPIGLLTAVVAHYKGQQQSV